jgi:hypothetical protein
MKVTAFVGRTRKGRSIMRSNHNYLWIGCSYQYPVIYHINVMDANYSPMLLYHLFWPKVERVQISEIN